MTSMMEKYREILKNQKFSQAIGTIDRIVGLRIESVGPIGNIGDLCLIEKSSNSEMIQCEIIGFDKNKVLLMPITSTEGLGYGDRVINTGGPVQIRVSPMMVGRVIDALGRPLDGKGELTGGEMVSLKGKPSNPFDRPRIDEPINLKIKAIDGLLTMGKGQRMGIFSGSGVGKSTLLGMIARNVEADINVIALVGERGREVNEFLQRDLKEDGLARSIVVVATSDQPAMMRSKCALMATAIAEVFRDQGKDVLLMMDSLTRFAMAEREIGLSAGESPISRGYTPSIYASLPRLLERAGRFKTGSITGLYTILVEGDDDNEPISDTVRGILDGHVMLTRKKAMKNHFPAIDVLASISRLMNDITEDKQRKSAGRLRSLLSVIEENEDLVSIGAYKAGSNPLLDEALRKNSAIQQFLKQGVDESVDVEQTLNAMERIVNG